MIISGIFAPCGLRQGLAKDVTVARVLEYRDRDLQFEDGFRDMTGRMGLTGGTQDQSEVAP
jgi:hypothetical protein